MTRRCTQREFLLRPSPVTNQIVRYVLAVALQRTRVQLHQCIVMSDHVHLVVTDPEARLPEFQHYFDGNVARAMNAVLGRSQAFWDDSGYNAVVLATPEAVVESSAYLLANPVAAGLVERGSEWPGVWTDPASIGGAPEVIERPNVFFRRNGPTPERVELRLTPPPGFTAEEYRSRVLTAVAAHEQNARAAVKAKGKTFLGVRRVLAQKTTMRATRPEKRGRLRPTIATRDRRARLEELSRLSQFLDRYRRARARFTVGIRDVVFPAGTYWLRVSCGVACEATG